MKRRNPINQVILILALWINSISFAQHVSVQMPRSHGYVGVPMKFVVVYENATSDVEPIIPDIDGFTILRPPIKFTSTQNTLINGNFSSTSTHTFTFILTPVRDGILTIPAMTFTVGDKTFQSTARQIIVEQPPAGGSLKVTVTGTTGDIYLGQHVDLTLQIFIEAFTDPELGITLNERDMFSTLQTESEFGIFTKAMQEGRIQIQQVQRNNDAGIPTTFYVFSVHAITWPETVGSFQANPITVLSNYPISLIRQRSFGLLGRTSLSIEQTHLIAAKATVPQIEVLLPPLNGKPAWFNGAVGTYDFNIVAEPTHVKVGEPITLTMRITDRTQDPINLDYLRAPLLDRIPSLTNSFKVPDAPLGGTTDGRTKIFTQSIRPLNDDVISIPPIPMSSFDPETGTYQTIWTNSIPITVDPVATISTNDLIGSNATSQQSNTKQLTEVQGGILANYTNETILTSQTSSITPFLLAGIATPPLVFGGILCTMLYCRRKHTPASLRKKTFKRIHHSMNQAIELQGVVQATHVSAALRAFISDLHNIGETQCVHEVESMLKRCNAIQFGGSKDETLASDAQLLVESIR